MASSAYWYNNALFQAFKQNLDLEGGTLEVLLVDSNYTFNANHVNVSEITNEVTNNNGTGYERKSVSGFSISLDSSNNKVNFDCNDVSYTAIDTNEDLRAMILYVKNTNDSDSVLVGYFQGEVLPTNGSDISLAISVSGLADVVNQLS